MLQKGGHQACLACDGDVGDLPVTQTAGLTFRLRLVFVLLAFLRLWLLLIL